MKTDTLEKEANRIADAIVELVERTNGFVTLLQVEREVPGFATHELPSWSYRKEYSGEERVLWDRMTEAGGKGLEKVLHGHRVAIQFVTLLPYILQDCIIEDETWLPIVLIPARAANLDTPNSVARATASGKPDHRLLTPNHVGPTPDQFLGVPG